MADYESNRSFNFTVMGKNGEKKEVTDLEYCEILIEQVEMFSTVLKEPEKLTHVFNSTSKLSDLIDVIVNYVPDYEADSPEYRILLRKCLGLKDSLAILHYN